MRWVAHAAGRPHRCAVIPFMGNSNSKLGFIDTGQQLPGWDPHVYISGEAVREMGRMFGLVPVHDAERQMQVIRRQKAEIEKLKAELAEAGEKLEAVAVLKRSGYRSSKTLPKSKAAA